MNDIDALRLFLAVAEQASFSGAARRLGQSPAVATRRIAALERSLAVRLFTRSTRHVSLTQEGVLLRDHARAIVDAVDEATEALRATRSRPLGRLRILARAGLARHLVVPYIAEFRARYPEVLVAVELSEDRVLALRESGCDVGITIGHLDDSSLVARRIAATDSLLFASPEYLARHGTPDTPEALADHACLTIAAADGGATWRFSRDAARYSVRFRAPVAVNDADALMICARAGLGIVMVADWLAHEDVARGSLVQVLGTYQVEPRGTPITALYPSRAHVPLKVRVFVDFLIEKCAMRFSATAA